MPHHASRSTKLSLKSHSKDFSTHDILLHPSLLPPDTSKRPGLASSPSGNAADSLVRIVEIRQNNVTVYVRLKQTEAVRGVLHISILHELLQHTLLQQMKTCHIRYVSLQHAALDYVRLSFRDQFLSRSDMWPFIRHLHNESVYNGKRIEYRGMRCTVKQMMRNQNQVHSGIITPNTKVTFRTQSAVIYALIEMSKEMWEYAIDGDIYWEKAIDGFCRDLFRKWSASNASHMLQIVLFGRYEIVHNHLPRQHHTHSLQFIKRLNHALSQLFPNSECFKLNDDMTCVDFFTLIDAHHVSFKNPTSLSSMIKHKFMEYHNNIQLLARDLSSLLHTSLDLSIVQSSDSNFLEALNLVLIAYQSHNVNRDLNHTGQYFIVLSAGVAVYNIYNTALSTISKKRIGDNGIGVDMICLSYPPLHHVPLFKYVHKQLAGENLYRSPDWLAVYFYDQKTYREQNSSAVSNNRSGGGRARQQDASSPAGSVSQGTLQLSSTPDYYQLPKTSKFIPTSRTPSLTDRRILPGSNSNLPLPQFHKVTRPLFVSPVDYEKHDAKVFDLSSKTEKQIVNSHSMENIAGASRRPASYIVHHSHSYGKKLKSLQNEHYHKKKRNLSPIAVLDSNMYDDALAEEKTSPQKDSNSDTRDTSEQHNREDSLSDTSKSTSQSGEGHPSKRSARNQGGRRRRKRRSNTVTQTDFRFTSASRSGNERKKSSLSQSTEDGDIHILEGSPVHHYNIRTTSSSIDHRATPSSPLSDTGKARTQKTRSQGGHSHGDRFLMPTRKSGSPLMRRFMFKLFNPFQNTIQNPMTVHLETSKRPSLHQKRWSHLYPSEPRSKQLKQNKSTALRPNWLSLVEPAILPMTTNFWPDRVTLSRYNHNNSHFVADEHYSTPSLMLELICQRLHQGYQIYQPQNETQSDMTHFYLSMSQQFHEIYIDEFNTEAVTVKRYVKKQKGKPQSSSVDSASKKSSAPSRKDPGKDSSSSPGSAAAVASSSGSKKTILKDEAMEHVSEHNSHNSSDSETESDDSFSYKYFMWNPLLKSFQNRETYFKNIPPDEYKWNLLDNIVSGYLDELPQHLATRCVQYHLVPCSSNDGSMSSPISAGTPHHARGVNPNIFSPHNKNSALHQFQKFLSCMTCRVFKPEEHSRKSLDVKILDSNGHIINPQTPSANSNDSANESRDSNDSESASTPSDTVDLNERRIGTTTRVKLEKNGERYEWVYLTTKDSYYAGESFFFQIHWLVCSAVTIDHYIQALNRKAKQCGFEMHATPIDLSWRAYSTPFRVYAQIELPQSDEGRVAVLKMLCEEPFHFHSELLPISVHSKRFVSGDGTIVIHCDSHSLWWLENPFSVHHNGNTSEDQRNLLQLLQSLVKKQVESEPKPGEKMETKA